MVVFLTMTKSFNEKQRKEQFQIDFVSLISSIHNIDIVNLVFSNLTIGSCPHKLNSKTKLLKYLFPSERGRFVSLSVKFTFLR